MILHGNDKTVSCTLVGDGMVGKTRICKVFAGGETRQDYTATVADEYNINTEMMGDKYTIKIIDSSGQHDYNEIRTQSYKDSNVFILCYSVTDRNSFESVDSFWMTEIRQQCKKTPVILVAIGSENTEHNKNVSKQEGLDILDKYECDAFVECKTFSVNEVTELFEYAVLSVIKRRRRRRSSILRALTAC